MEIEKLLDLKKKLNYKDKNFNDLQEYIIVGISYIVSTIILTYPVAFKIKTDIPGVGGDSFQWMRILWYTKVLIHETNLTTLTHDYLLFYPTGIESMPFPSAFNQIMYLLLSPFLELHVIYTILWLLTFIIGAMGSYLLVKYLTENKYAAFVAGIIFAFSPYHFSRSLYFFGAATIQWIPFCAFFLMKTVKEGGTKNPIIAGIFFILVAMSDLQYLVFMGIFTGLVFLYDFYGRITFEKNFLYSLREMIKKYSLFGIVTFLGVLPLTVNEVLTSLSNQNFLKPSPYQIPELSNDLVSFFLPSHLHPFLGKFTLDLYSNIPSWFAEKVNFIGYIVLGLSAFVFLRLRKNPEVKFWLIATFFFSIISLGPILHINGESSFTVFNINIPLPYLVLYDTVPFLNNCRAVGRFFVIATLGYSVLAGYGLSELLKYKAEKKALILIVVSLLVVFEFLCIPYPTTQITVPDFYSKISNDTDNYALLEIPQNFNAGYMNFEYLYYQTIHQKPLVGGYAARFPADVENFQRDTPFIRELNNYSLPDKDILPDVTQIGSSILNTYNIRYVIIHKNQLSSEQTNFTSELLKKALNTEPDVYAEDRLIVYRVQNETVLPFMALKDGWNSLEKLNGVPTRWMSNNATITIYSDAPKTTALKFQTCSFYRPRTLEVYNGKALQSRQIINTNFATISTPINLENGANIIILHVPEGSERPSDLPELKNNDSRELSIAIQDFQLTQSSK